MEVAHYPVDEHGSSKKSVWGKQNRTSLLWKQTQCRGINEDLVCAGLELVIKLFNQRWLMCLDMEIDEMYWQRATVWSMTTSVPVRPSDPTYSTPFQHLHSGKACFIKAPNLYITKCYWWLLKRFLKSEIDGTEVFLNIVFLGQFLLRDPKKKKKRWLSDTVIIIMIEIWYFSKRRPC